MGVARAVTVATLAGALLAGCGSGSSNPQAQQPPVPQTDLSSPGRDATAPSGTISSDQATKLAAAGVLIASDLPGFTGQAQSQDAEDDSVDKASYQCLGISAPTYLHRDYGTEFDKDPKEIDSSADVVGSVAEATGEFTAFASDKGAGCYAPGFQGDVEDAGLKVTTATVTLVAATVTGADRTYAYHLSATGTDENGKASTIDGFVVGVLVGQTEISLTSTVSDATADLAQAEQLAAMLVSRVKGA